MSVIKPSMYDESLLDVGDPTKKKNGTFLSISYEGEPLLVNAAMDLLLPFGADFYPLKNGGKWNVKVALPTDNNRAMAFYDIIESVEYVVRERATELKIKAGTMDELFAIAIKPGGVSDDGSSYSPTFQFKIHMGELPTFFDADKNVIEDPNVDELLTQGASIRLCVRLKFAWVIQGRMGVSWVAEQIQIQKAGAMELPLVLDD